MLSLVWSNGYYEKVLEKDMNVKSQIDNQEVLHEEVTVREAGRRGGLATRDRYGSKFYRRIGYKGGESTRKRYASQLKEFGRLGGRRRRPSISTNTGEEDHK